MGFVLARTNSNTVWTNYRIGDLEHGLTELNFLSELDASVLDLAHLYATSGEFLNCGLYFRILSSTGPRLDVAYWHRSGTFRVCPKLMVFAMTQISC